MAKMDLDKYRDFINNNLVICYSFPEKSSRIMDDNEIAYYLEHPCVFESGISTYPNEKLCELYKMIYGEDPDIEGVVCVHETMRIE